MRVIKPWFWLWFIGISAAWDCWFPISVGNSAWCFLLSRNFVLMEEDFRRIPTQSPLGPMSDMNSNFRNRDLSSTCGKCGQTNMTAIALIFWESFGQPRPTTQNNLLMHGVRFLLFSLTLWGSFANPNGKFHLNYTHICLFTYLLYYRIFRQIVLFVTFFWQTYCSFTLPSPFVLRFLPFP